MIEYFKKGPDTKYELKNVPLDKENMWFAQLDGSIRYAFMKYAIPLPKYVIVYFYTAYTEINIIRDYVSNISEAEKWLLHRTFVLDELQLQAEANSNEENAYTIKIL